MNYLSLFSGFWVRTIVEKSFGSPLAYITDEEIMRNTPAFHCDTKEQTYSSHTLELS